jgi:uncharacterized membrane protein YfcA
VTLITSTEKNMQTIYLILIGIAAGVLAGLFGVGGGIIIVPSLIFLLGMSQHTATGTSLVALLLPVGILGVWNYFRSGQISFDDVKYGLIVAGGLFVGTFFGTKLSLQLSDDVLRKVFAVFLVLIALRMFFFKK